MCVCIPASACWVLTSRKYWRMLSCCLPSRWKVFSPLSNWRLLPKCRLYSPALLMFVHQRIPWRRYKHTYINWDQVCLCLEFDPCMWCRWYFTSSESHNLVSLQLSPNSSKRSHTKNNTHRPILYFGCNKSIGPSNTSCGSNNFIVHKIEIMSVHRNIFKISVVWKQEETQISLPFRLFPIPTPPDPPPTRNDRPHIWRSPMIYLRWKNN
jgi:hypothetical protein